MQGRTLLRVLLMLPFAAIRPATAEPAAATRRPPARPPTRTTPHTGPPPRRSGELQESEFVDWSPNARGTPRTPDRVRTAPTR